MRMEWYRKEFLGVRTEATESSCGRSERVYDSHGGMSYIRTIIHGE